MIGLWLHECTELAPAKRRSRPGLAHGARMPKAGARQPGRSLLLLPRCAATPTNRSLARRHLKHALLPVPAAAAARRHCRRRQPRRRRSVLWLHPEPRLHGRVVADPDLRRGGAPHRHMAQVQGLRLQGQVGELGRARQLSKGTEQQGRGATAMGPRLRGRQRSCRGGPLAWIDPGRHHNRQHRVAYAFARRALPNRPLPRTATHLHQHHLPTA